MKNKNSAINDACQFFGGQAKLAKQLNIAPPTVNEWVSGGRAVPPLRCVEIEKLTAGKVSRKDLRPNDWWLWWPELSA